jgi:hypothetical protein
MIGIDGKEYPAPTQEQLQEVFTAPRYFLWVRDNHLT